jgi:hypothetical protein
MVLWRMIDWVDGCVDCRQQLVAEGLSSVKAWGDSLSLFSHIMHHNFA